MYKRTFKSFVIMTGVTLLLAMCTKDDKGIFTYNTKINLQNSSVAADQMSDPKGEFGTQLYYSTDGTHFVPYMNLSIGQKYQIKVFDKQAGIFLDNSNCFQPYFGKSTPVPDTTGSADVPTFTLATNNNIVVDVVNHPYKPFNAASWAGAWGGDEVGACCGGTDANTLTEDPTDPNKFVMDNFWGDHVDAYIEFTPSTNGDTATQVVTLPPQTTDDPGQASGTGKYDQCTGTFYINTTYVAFGGTYKWRYNFHR